jgi:hypothetical protein
VTEAQNGPYRHILKPFHHVEVGQL